MALEPRQQAFCEEYLVDLDATQAAIRAGYSPRSARQQATRLMTKASVRACIDAAMAERSRRTGITQDRVLRELARVAFVTPTDVIDPETGRVRDDASEDDLAVIASVKVKYIPYKQPDGEGGVEVVDAVEREVRMADKIKALDLLAKHLGMYGPVRDRDAAAETGAAGVIIIPAVLPADTGEGSDGQ